MSDNLVDHGLQCVAVIVCNDVIEDRRTNNKTLVSVFNTILTKQLPVQQPRMFVLTSVTNALGMTDFKVKLTDPYGEIVLSIDVHLDSSDPLATHDPVMELIGVPFNHAGVYSFDVVSDRGIIGSRRFTVSYEP